MVRVGSYIDAGQDKLSTATPTFGILHSEGRSSYLRTWASTYRNEQPPQPFLGLPRVNWLPKREIEGSWGGLFSGVGEEEMIRRSIETLVEAREARF